MLGMDVFQPQSSVVIAGLYQDIVLSGSSAGVCDVPGINPPLCAFLFSFFFSFFFLFRSIRMRPRGDADVLQQVVRVGGTDRVLSMACPRMIAAAFVAHVASSHAIAIARAQANKHARKPKVRTPEPRGGWL